MSDPEICWNCGESVKFGSGRFVNRIPDFNTEEERREMGHPYPQGEYLCAECEDGFEKEINRCKICGAIADEISPGVFQCQLEKSHAYIFSV